MCYDISFSSSIEMITDYLPGIAVDNQLRLEFPTLEHVQAQAYRNYPVIIFEDGSSRLTAFEWGLIADYMNTEALVKKNRNWMCNAQSEKILRDKRSYWWRIRSSRCLIPVTSIFEHRYIAGWKNKVPYLVKIRERNLFCIPGLYHYSPIPDAETGEVTGTFTLITRPANALMKQIHNGGPNAGRMPLFLPKELELAWLDPGMSEAKMQSILEFEMDSAELTYWPVFSIRTVRERPDQKSKVDPFEWPDLPELGSMNPG